MVPWNLSVLSSLKNNIRTIVLGEEVKAKSVCARTGGEGSKITKSKCIYFIDDPLPDRLKSANSHEIFKLEIKKWKPENCP